MSHNPNRTLFALVASLAFLSPLAGADPYAQAPERVNRILHAPQPPDPFLSPNRQLMILAQPVRNPPIADLAQPMLRLAGVRVLTGNRGQHAASYWTAFDLVKIPEGTTTHVELPKGCKAGIPHWSRDSRHYAFTVSSPKAIELWVGEAPGGKVHRIAGIQLNPFFGDPLEWMPDQKTLLVRAVPSGQGPAPGASAPPSGPNIQETTGAKGPSSTYEVRDVLKSPGDEALFDYYGKTQPALVDVTRGSITRIGKADLYDELSSAPDGRHILVETVHRPYSYLTTYSRFPREVDVWDGAGKRLAHVASLPCADSVPIWGVPTGPREFTWRATEPATLLWPEAQDGGNWKTQVPFRDRLMSWKAPFEGKPTQLTQTVSRFTGLAWSAQGGQALLSEHDAIKHWTRTSWIDMDASRPEPRILWEQSSDDRYKDPGRPVRRPLSNGYSVLEQDGDFIYLSGAGASPQGDRPFLDRFHLKTLRTERLFRSEKTAYEGFIAWYDRSKGEFLTRHETPQDPPNLFLRTLREPIAAAEPGEAQYNSVARAVTHIPDPTPEVRGITKRLVTYKRADGLDLSFTLYLPPGYQEGTRLPAVLWAYPLDYADAKMAGQVGGSTQRFTNLGWPLQLFFLLDGYAVIDNPSMPVVGDTNKIYDTYMEQLIAGAQAAVDKAVDLGVVDRDRIGVTGHSHGGLMTVNLLAHSSLFRAGIARSGAYNRSLTAFGFQNERRTLWEAPDVYTKVSPFFHADKIKSPLLLIHGAADVNPGTVPLQSETLFEAIRGNGGTARLIMLPYESHGYKAMESTEHILYEMLAWFDKYVKNAPRRASK